MDRVLLVVIALSAIIALVGCHGGDNVTGGPSRVVCFSGGQIISEHYVPGIVWRDSAGYAFDLTDGTAVNVSADCVVEEIQ